ncbi:hypothetical protein SIID45300_01891 [Candidatus Magnetaquicoccaceae bacterium FCR-1]|uniref:Inorganic phosphate transporter n=1 Tax=Candidatus Magnetaquiglobus chichijimensis TaxID=3141448 RepID=A0ABQ0CA35_9PROT
MDTPFFLFLIGGMPLGWLLGGRESTHACGAIQINRVLPYRHAAIACALFVLLGATLNGAGVGRTLAMSGQLHASCAAMIATGITVMLHSLAWIQGHRLPVVQTLVGALIGCLLHDALPSQPIRFAPILAGWLVAPFVAALLGRGLYQTGLSWLARRRIHLLTRDALTRQALLLASLFTAYALGANNLAAVTGPFLAVGSTTWSTPFDTLGLGIQALPLLGGIAMAAGLIHARADRDAPPAAPIPLSPLGMAVATFSSGLTLLLFASESVASLLAATGLPAISLVPLSLEQTMAGAVAGITSIHGLRFIDWRFWLRTAAGMLLVPLFAACVTFVVMFLVTHVLNLCRPI